MIPVLVFLVTSMLAIALAHHQKLHCRVGYQALCVADHYQSIIEHVEQKARDTEELLCKKNIELSMENRKLTLAKADMCEALRQAREAIDRYDDLMNCQLRVIGRFLNLKKLDPEEGVVIYFLSGTDEIKVWEGDVPNFESYFAPGSGHSQIQNIDISLLEVTYVSSDKQHVIYVKKFGQ